jgi:transketolase C-terminal domain/subunit
MSAQILSFTRTISDSEIQQAMNAALLAVATERDDAVASVADSVLARQLVTMAAAYNDLAAQLGIAPAAAVARLVDRYLAS